MHLLFFIDTDMHYNITATAALEPRGTVTPVTMTARSTARASTASLMTQTATMTRSLMTHTATMTRSNALSPSDRSSTILSSSQAVLASPKPTSVGAPTQAEKDTNIHKTAMPVPTESPNPINASQQNTNSALYIGVTVPLVALLFIVAMTAVVTVVCIGVKKKEKPQGEYTFYIYQ